MGLFAYEVKKPGETKPDKGVIQATSITEANRLLRGQNYFVLSIEETSEKKQRKGGIFHKKVGLKEKIIFSRQLAVMNKAGLSIIKALESLSKQTENQYFHDVLKDMIDKVRGGQILSKAMERYPDVFPEIYVAVIRAGEQTGQLSEVLLTLADQQEREADLIGKVKGAMIYPAVIFTLLIGVVVLIIMFVIPSLQTIFTESGTELPILTRILIGTSNIARNYWWLILPGLVGIFFLLRMWARTPRGQEIYDKGKISIPIFGGLTKKVYMARFSRTMAMLIKASLPILVSIQIIRKTISNVHYDRAFARIEKSVESGKTFSSAIEHEDLFPPMVSQLVSLGEESGNMESVLLEIASFYDREVDSLSKNLTTLLEPIMLVVMGIGIGFVVASVLGPIYNLVEAF